MGASFDHLVIGAAELEQGGRWASERFGCLPNVGGAHPVMGTHNLLARMATGFLEIIAIDPEATPPARRRWFGLDDSEQVARLRARPRPIAWVLAVDDLDRAAERAGWPVGELIHVGRGDLTWRITVPSDGSVAEGVLPGFIEWPESLGGRAPTDRMAPLGGEARPLTLATLQLGHPEPERIKALLESVDAIAVAEEAGFSLTVDPHHEPRIEAEFRSVD